MLLARIDNTGSVREVVLTGRAVTFDASDGAMILDVLDARDIERDMRARNQKARKLSPGQLKIDIAERFKSKAHKLRRNRKHGRYRTDRPAR
ncbi:hypothetical protein LCGC14_2719390 [marine sediment metagenome]|uniref:Uncharacterized protein n=1 Tax=marine sediment metagenome TaxID=412755 RepID=A0A0F8ZY37_9ZZZZ